MSQILDLKEFIPSNIKSGKNGNIFPLTIMESETKYVISYWTNVSNQTDPNVGKRKYESMLPKNLEFDKITLEVIGLLQGEMSKTYRGPVTFCNSQPLLMKKILEWFENYFDLPSSNWHWYIKINIPKQAAPELNKVLEEELIDFWMEVCPLDYGMKYPVTLSFVSTTKNQIPKNQGTLIIERTVPIFVQTLQKLVNDITFSMPTKSDKEIIAFMRGLIAAEACINFSAKTGHYRVFITATNDDERQVFEQCLNKLGIETKDCKPIKDIVISRKENIRKLHELDLMSLNPEKHKRFLEMLNSYQTF